MKVENIEGRKEEGLWERNRLSIADKEKGPSSFLVGRPESPPKSHFRVRRRGSLPLRERKRPLQKMPPLSIGLPLPLYAHSVWVGGGGGPSSFRPPPELPFFFFPGQIPSGKKIVHGKSKAEERRGPFARLFRPFLLSQKRRQRHERGHKRFFFLC